MQEQDEVAEKITQTLGFFVEEYKPSNIAFPILTNTYALWRKYSYQQIQQLSSFKKDPGLSNFKFFLHSQGCFLKKFIQKTVNRLSSHPIGNVAGVHLSQSGSIDDKIIERYNKALQLHTLYQQLLQDMVTLPYLADLFSGNNKYQLKEQYCPDIVGFKENKEVSQKVSDTLVSKGIGIIAEKIFTKTFIISASSFAIRLNPICMVASFAFGELIGKYRKDKKGEEIEQKITQALSNTQKKAEDLKNFYQECVGLLGVALREGGDARQRFLSKLKEVMVQDWLSIEKAQDEDGWQIVELSNSKQYNCE